MEKTALLYPCMTWCSFKGVIYLQADEWTIFGYFWSNGRIRSATSPLLVDESIAEAFCQRLFSWSKNIKISDPREEATFDMEEGEI
ncbi:hypothetical protein MKW98_010904 [Papaver atlanticum]|uniref:Uncharacterized protein n=1 Tax=Papaver atlanticum TaxID=357466 RepID=A0AAD4XH15_9MAGN|nr:hypothetical protein MKW98_010904 [Papaver atlanticum]